MKLTIASQKSKLFACKNFHYSKSLPVNTFGYNVYNDQNEWCGVILFGLGANNNLSRQFSMVQGEVAELVRVALNGKQKSTGQCLSVAMRLIIKDYPTVKILVSYADEGQGHKGIIYQATNWIYIGDSFSESTVDPETGKAVHSRILHSKYGTTRGFTRVKDKAKHKYIYPLYSEYLPLCLSMKKDKIFMR